MISRRRTLLLILLMNLLNFIKKLTPRNVRRTLAAGVVIVIGFSCQKENNLITGTETKTPAIPAKCGILLTRPVLDSFQYPTCYISALIDFPEGREIVHLQYNVAGSHDGSWFLTRYDKDSSFC